MLDQLQPSTEQFASPSGLRVRQDLYDEDYSDEDYEQMLSMYEGTMSQIVEGEIVKSKVLRVTENAVILDVGFKSEGSVPLDEFKDPQSLKEGDEVEVFLEHLEDQEGAVVLSKKKADFMRVWEKIRVAHESDQPVEGTLVKKIKGGVVVNLMGVDAFLPGSQIALRRVPNIDELLGQTYEFKIIKLNKRRRNIVVSRRVILENERARKREHLMKELAVGQVRKGVVKNITDFGAFIDLGGVDGLLHITDMSTAGSRTPPRWSRSAARSRSRCSTSTGSGAHHPRHEAAPVLSVENVAAKYPVGTRVQGKVVSITNYGAFVEIEPGIEGLVHISEMVTRNVRHPSKIVTIGETIEAVVLKVDETEEKISLGMKQTEQDPWMVLPLSTRWARGFGQGAEPHQLRRLRGDRAGHRWPDPHLRHVLDQAGPAPVGSGAEGRRGRRRDPRHRCGEQAHLPRPQAGEEDLWLRIGETYPSGSTRGTVVRLMEEGRGRGHRRRHRRIVPISQLGIPNLENPGDAVKEGQPVDLKVLEVDPIHHRIVLMVTNYPDEPIIPPVRPVPEEEVTTGQ